MGCHGASLHTVPSVGPSLHLSPKYHSHGLTTHRRVSEPELQSPPCPREIGRGPCGSGVKLP